MFHFVSFYFILFHFISLYFILFYFILFHFNLKFSFKFKNIRACDENMIGVESHGSIDEIRVGLIDQCTVSGSIDWLMSRKCVVFFMFHAFMGGIFMDMPAKKRVFSSEIAPQKECGQAITQRGICNSADQGPWDNGMGFRKTVLISIQTHVTSPPAGATFPKFPVRPALCVYVLHRVRQTTSPHFFVAKKIKNSAWSVQLSPHIKKRESGLNFFSFWVVSVLGEKEEMCARALSAQFAKKDTDKKFPGNI